MKPWFVVKRYGVGLSPSGWGWPFTVGYIVLVVLGPLWIRLFGATLAFAGLAGLTLGFFVVMALTSDRKPWRWRWGGDDPLK